MSSDGKKADKGRETQRDRGRDRERDRNKERALWSLVCRTLALWGQGPTPVISFTLNYFLRQCSTCKYSHPGG